MNTSSTIAPDAHTFDPATWLDNFKSIGGGWTARPGGETILGILVCGNPGEGAARAMLDNLSSEQSSQIDAYIRERGLLPCQTPNDAVLGAWERRKAAFARYNALPIADDTDPTYDADDQLTDAERHEWAIINDAEAAMVAATVTTPRAVAAILWTALSHSLTDRAQDEAAVKGDLAAMLAFDERLDWDERLILAALRSLHAMEG